MEEKKKEVLLPVAEVFLSIQGEGLRTGRPSIFIRTIGCNLCCSFRNPDGKATLCDTAYASITPEKAKYRTVKETIDAVQQILMEYPNVRDIVLTGGQPTIHWDGINELLHKLKYLEPGRYITMETNGTLPPGKDRHDLDALGVDLWSISPKLGSSCFFEGTNIPLIRQEQHKKLRINFSQLAEYLYSNNDKQWKFVWTGSECEKEIHEIFNQMRLLAPDPIAYNHIVQKYPVLLMPEGQTDEEIRQSTTLEMLDACYRNNWAYCDRVHVHLWGDKRGV